MPRDIAPVRAVVVEREDTVFFTAFRDVVVLFVRFVVARVFVAREEFFIILEDCRADVAFVSFRVRALGVRVAAPAKPMQKHRPRKTDSIFLIPFFYFLVMISKIQYFKQGYFIKKTHYAFFNFEIVVHWLRVCVQQKLCDLCLGHMVSFLRGLFRQC